MSTLRVMTPEDIPVAAALFQKTFRDPRAKAPASLERVLHELLFEHPEADPELPSRVFLGSDGAVAGFMGTLPLRMSYRGRKVRAAVPTSLSIDDPKRDRMAGLQLVRAFLSGPQDLSISEPISLAAQGMWEKLGGVCVPSESMEWLRIFRPCSLPLAQKGNSQPLRAAKAFARMLDRAAVKIAPGYLAPAIAARAVTRDAEATDGELFAAIADFKQTYALHPDWPDRSLKWMLAHAGQNATRGPVHRRIVFDAGDKKLGCYLYQGKPGGIAWTMQILAQPNAAGTVIDSMFAHAWKLGTVAIKGRTELRLLEPLMQRRCLFFRRHSAVAHSRDPELIAAVKAGEGITSGFATEAWLRLGGEHFH
jgi:hypothetical protein